MLTMGIQIHSSVIPRTEEALMEFMRIPDGAADKLGQSRNSFEKWQNWLKSASV